MESQIERAKVPRLDAHNNSIDLCISTFTDIFNSSADDQNWVKMEEHSIVGFRESSDGQPLTLSPFQEPTLSHMTTLLNGRKRNTKTIAISSEGRSRYQVQDNHNFQAQKSENGGQRLDEILGQLRICSLECVLEDS